MDIRGSIRDMRVIDLEIRAGMILSWKKLSHMRVTRGTASHSVKTDIMVLDSQIVSLSVSSVATLDGYAYRGLEALITYNEGPYREFVEPLATHVTGRAS